MRTFFLLLLLSFYGNQSYAQHIPSEIVANKIAQKMKDSLSLTEEQKTELATINMQINQSKAAVWQQYSTDSLIQVNLQLVENTRDSLYMPVLTTVQHQLYLSKKRTLLKND